MINKVIIRRFKRFNEVVFDIPGHIVLAGPNNAGKTTLLQAIAAWDVCFRRWKELNDFHRHGGAYTYAHIARQAFAAVPLRQFDLLWNQRSTNNPIEIEIQNSDGWRIAMELHHDTTEQVKIRPKAEMDPAIVKNATLSTVFVPPMTGLSTQEPLYARQEYLDATIGQGKPGEVLRNLLVHASQNESAWRSLQDTIKRLFNYQLLIPDAKGAHIITEYQTSNGGPRFDIASAGSGFQQVLMLLTFLYTRPGSVLLLDEPDAHLHLILQDAIYSELRDVALKQHSQLIVATHSEVIINSVEPRELCVMLQQPRMVSDTRERSNLILSLSVLSNADIMLAMDSPGVLYTEGHTDVAILREWARILSHPVYEYLTKRLFWKPSVWENREGSKGILAKDHYEAIKLVREGISGLVLVDGDNRPEIRSTEITGEGLQRLRWNRYEIESYLVHPGAIARFVENQVGRDAAAPHLEDLRKHFEDAYPPAFLKDPLGDHQYLNSTKARTNLIPPALEAAGLPAIPYTRFNEIAALMKPEEIHPEVKEKLDSIGKALNI